MLYCNIHLISFSIPRIFYCMLTSETSALTTHILMAFPTSSGTLPYVGIEWIKNAFNIFYRKKEAIWTFCLARNSSHKSEILKLHIYIGFSPIKHWRTNVMVNMQRRWGLHICECPYQTHTQMVALSLGFLPPPGNPVATFQDVLFVWRTLAGHSLIPLQEKIVCWIIVLEDSSDHEGAFLEG